eukprot:4424197-Prymnesium_polylepis.1
MFGDMTLVAGRPREGARRACYSPGWRLLASADGPVVRLWDLREPPRQAAGQIALPAGSLAGS